MTTYLTRKDVSVRFSTASLADSAQVLRLEGFEVAPPTLELLEAGIVLVAHNTATTEGYLIDAQELRLLNHYGIGFLRGFNEPHQINHTRTERYLEMALARAVVEVRSAPIGGRNQTLNAVAYSLGRLEHIGLDLHRAGDELVAAGMDAGLDEWEARATAIKALAKGAESPKDLPPGCFTTASNPSRGVMVKVEDVQDRHRRNLERKYRGRR